LGLFHNLSQSIRPTPENTSFFVTISARSGSAVAFGLLVLLVGHVATNWYGRAAGLIAAGSLVLMPRLFGHAHLAALETVVGLTYTAAVLAVASCWNPANKVSGKTACLTGIVFGLALLTKIQAVLLPIPIALWAVYHGRQRALLPLVVWGVSGLVIFFLLWPWLWIDPLGHLAEYLGRTVGRRDLYVWYFGKRIVDSNVPWHYPAVMFLTTVPVGLQVLGGMGLGSKDQSILSQPREQLVLACLLFPLILFSLPGIAVYDGARLFLVVFPLWAILIGKGGAIVLKWISRRTSPKAGALIITLFVAAQGYGLFVTAPCYLSYYNLLVGGLPGADRMGLATTYWRDSVTRSLLWETAQLVPDGEVVILVPVLHPVEPGALESQTPALRARNISLKRWDEVPADKRKYLLVFQREADVPPIVAESLQRAHLLAEVSRQGVQLAALYDLQP
jgi:4-amino-4-deoxy-L-arabinose transferase-like glycosyltransferase